MQLSQISPIKLLALQEKIAREIAKVDGYNFDSVDLADYAKVNPRANGYMVKAEAAISAMKAFGIY